MTATLGWVARIVLWMVILAACAVLLAAVVAPRLAGATPYAVMSGSMEPRLTVGSLVITRSTDPEEIGVGDVITYQLASGKRAVVTHRVVQVGINGEGEHLFQTCGDANDAPDQEWVRAVQVRGVGWYSLPYLGYANDWLSGRQRQLGVYGLAAVLLGYALVMAAAAFRERRQEATDD